MTKNKKLKILVFDDKEINREAAKAQLQDHEVTVVGTYDEAESLVQPLWDQEKILKNLSKQFPQKEYGNEYYQARYNMQRSTSYPKFDVFLGDLLVPPSHKIQEGKKHEGEMPVGIFIGLLAAVVGKIPYIAIFTDSDHHHHPASAAFDPFNFQEYSPTPFTIEESKVLLTNSRGWFTIFDPINPGQITPEPFKSRYCPQDNVELRSKNWAALLDYLLNA